RAASPRSARSSTPSIWCSRCSSAISARCSRVTSRPDPLSTRRQDSGRHCLNLRVPYCDPRWGCADFTRRLAMKIALLALLGLILGSLGGAALGIGAGIAWVEIFNTTNFEGYSGMLVFFTFMPLGAIVGGLGGALVFGMLAFRDTEIAIE